MSLSSSLPYMTMTLISFSFLILNTVPAYGRLSLSLGRAKAGSRDITNRPPGRDFESGCPVCLQDFSEDSRPCVGCENWHVCCEHCIALGKLPECPMCKGDWGKGDMRGFPVDREHLARIRGKESPFTFTLSGSRLVENIVLDEDATVKKAYHVVEFYAGSSVRLLCGDTAVEESDGHQKLSAICPGKNLSVVVLPPTPVEAALGVLANDPSVDLKNLARFSDANNDPNFTERPRRIKSPSERVYLLVDRSGIEVVAKRVGGNADFPIFQTRWLKDGEKWRLDSEGRTWALFDAVQGKTWAVFDGYLSNNMLGFVMWDAMWDITDEFCKIAECGELRDLREGCNIM